MWNLSAIGPTKGKRRFFNNENFMPVVINGHDGIRRPNPIRTAVPFSPPPLLLIGYMEDCGGLKVKLNHSLANSH